MQGGGRPIFGCGSGLEGSDHGGGVVCCVDCGGCGWGFGVVVGGELGQGEDLARDDAGAAGVVVDDGAGG